MKHEDKFDFESEHYIFKDTYYGKMNGMFMGVLNNILRSIPNDFSNEILKGDIESIFKLYDLEEISLYAEETKNKQLIQITKHNNQSQWLNVLAGLSELLYNNTGQSDMSLDDIEVDIYNKIKKHKKCYNKEYKWSININ